MTLQLDPYLYPSPLDPTKPIVLWKDEDDGCGKVTVFHDARLLGSTWPYGSPPHDGIEKHGWLTIPEAKQLAKDLDGQLVDEWHMPME